MMPIALADFIEDFASALKTVDSAGKRHKNFQPGIGPFGEADALREALSVLQLNSPQRYRGAPIKRQPDLLIPNEWQIEFKLVRPFGDNGKSAEHWSENLLHPYAGNTSSIGDALKLIAAPGNERKTIVVFGYEHYRLSSLLSPDCEPSKCYVQTLCTFDYHVASRPSATA